MNCNNLSKINIPSSLISLGNDAFYGCSKLVEFDFSNLKRIGLECFAGTSITNFRMKNIEYYPNTRLYV
ncbi:MAG: leucine-rich repeat domain-containing protein [Ureaplasma sp.]|nr:leucine-rich repeat domain-containing protein [Ureaplasma sp.]MDE6289749.1 leucine-rich repeat domain-containing protein [Ureaplasma sp.]